MQTRIPQYLMDYYSQAVESAALVDSRQKVAAEIESVLAKEAGEREVLIYIDLDRGIAVWEEEDDEDALFDFELEILEMETEELLCG